VTRSTDSCLITSTGGEDSSPSDGAGMLRDMMCQDKITSQICFNERLDSGMLKEQLRQL
jgi:hypothetical protein